MEKGTGESNQRHETIEPGARAAAALHHDFSGIFGIQESEHLPKAIVDLAKEGLHRHGIQENQPMISRPVAINRGQPNFATAAETTTPPFSPAAFITASASSFAIWHS